MWPIRLSWLMTLSRWFILVFSVSGTYVVSTFKLSLVCRLFPLIIQYKKRSQVSLRFWFQLCLLMESLQSFRFLLIFVLTLNSQVSSCWSCCTFLLQTQCFPRSKAWCSLETLTPYIYIIFISAQLNANWALLTKVVVPSIHITRYLIRTCLNQWL